jgi:hypothetical protein
MPHKRVRFCKRSVLSLRAMVRRLRLDRGPMPHTILPSTGGRMGGRSGNQWLPSSGHVTLSSLFRKKLRFVHSFVRSSVCWCGVMRRTGKTDLPVCVPRVTSTPCHFFYLDPNSRLLNVEPHTRVRLSHNGDRR